MTYLMLLASSRDSAYLLMTCLLTISLCAGCLRNSEDITRDPLRDLDSEVMSGFDDVGIQRGGERGTPSDLVGGEMGGELIAGREVGGEAQPACPELQPDTCDDGDPCTVDSRTGDASTCDVECVYTPIQECGLSDQCCPSQCNALNDNDCAVSCTGDRRCVPEPPEGWTGLATVHIGAEAVECASPFSASDISIYQNISHAQAECTCSCGEVSGECGSIEVSSALPTMCFGTAPQEIPFNQCTILERVNGPCARGRWTEGPSSVQCPVMSTADLGDVKWDDRVTLCESSVLPGECEAQEVCAPRAPDGFEGVCIYREGDHMCPLGFPQRVTGYTGYSDTRSCSPCTCIASADSVGCSTTLRSYTERRCSIPSSTPNEARIESTAYSGNTAISIDMAGFYLFAEPPTLTGACDPNGGEARGGVTTTGIYTICCDR